MPKSVGLFFRQHWLIVVVIALATWLRVFDLQTKAIFFGDAGRDLLVASQSITDRQLPLLGIPSSVPRFRQGPLTIWLEMLLFIGAGYQLLPYSLVFALLSIMAVIGLYELTTVYLSRKQGIVAAALLAASPLAVAHGRMVYHITPIPLMLLIFFWSLLRLWHHKPYSWFWASFSWCLLFQFELAVLPLVLLIPYCLWRQRQPLTKTGVAQLAAGFLIGLLPQIVYDLTHQFAQLGGFVVWVAYRIASAVSIVGEHAVGPSSLSTTLHQFTVYGTRIVSVDQPLVAVLAIFVLALSAWFSWRLWRQRRLPVLMELAWIGTGLLVAAFSIHSSPSEAYFPVFLILVPLLISYGLCQLTQPWQRLSFVGVAAWCGLMVVSINQHQWFLGSQTSFSYGPSVAEQRQVVEAARHLSHDDFQFTTMQSAGAFPSYFDNLRWLSLEVGVRENPNGSLIFVEPKDSVLTNYPTATKVTFPTQDVYVYE